MTSSISELFTNKIGSLDQNLTIKQEQSVREFFMETMCLLFSLSSFLSTGGIASLGRHVPGLQDKVIRMVIDNWFKSSSISFKSSEEVCTP